MMRTVHRRVHIAHKQCPPFSRRAKLRKEPLEITCPPLFRGITAAMKLEPAPHFPDTTPARNMRVDLRFSDGGIYLRHVQRPCLGPVDVTHAEGISVCATEQGPDGNSTTPERSRGRRPTEGMFSFSQPSFSSGPCSYRVAELSCSPPCTKQQS